MLDADLCYRALRARDARFDGRFFVGVSSTHIYCRPVCPARQARRDRCRFFMTAAAAEAEGFRPCLRCRPELAPGNAAIDSRQRLAVLAAGLIEDGLVPDEGGLAALAGQLGVTGRHLRRVFQAEFGVSPVAFAQTQCLLLAKRLLTDTRLPVTDVALASGFGSLRRFNALFKTRYRLTPSALRTRIEVGAARDGFRFVLRYQRPFDWPSLLGFLAHRTIEGVERVDTDTYRRMVRVVHRGTSHIGWIAASHAEAREGVALVVQPTLARVLPQVVARVKRVFDLSCPIRDVESALGTLAARHPGLRVPGAFDGFEMAVRAILGQQVTVKAARTLAGRFVNAFGDRVESPLDGLGLVFPQPERIAALSVSSVAGLGIVSARAHAIVGLARYVAAGTLTLEPGADVNAALDRLRAIPGVGEWTAQYIAMRALAWPDAFLESDIGVMKALQERHRGRIREHAEAWRPWGSYAVMHLWRGLEESGSTTPARGHASKSIRPAKSRRVGDSNVGKGRAPRAREEHRDVL
jgi:AraC family transcriptional regulator of adaptative response / DNA-3-methyladenine glycosylase II